MPLAFTVFQLAWSTAWGALHVRVRKGRRYSRDRAATGIRDELYRRLNPLLFVGQLVLTIACFWGDARGLLKFHDLAGLRWLGTALLAVALLLTLTALRHLGDNYSPCYDAHAPKRLVATGPYAIIRHPLYCAKLLAGAGTVLLSGSLWFIPSTAYLFAVTWRATKREDAQLRATLSGYESYVERTWLLVPYLL